MIAIRMRKPDSCSDCPIQDKHYGKCQICNEYTPMAGSLLQCPLLDVEHLAVVHGYSDLDNIELPQYVKEEQALRDISSRIASAIMKNESTRIICTKQDDIHESTTMTRADVWIVKAGSLDKKG